MIAQGWEAGGHNLQGRLGAPGLPTFVMLVNGQEVDRSVGMTSRERLLAMLSKAPQASGDAAAPQLTDWQNSGPSDSSSLPMRPDRFGSPTATKTRSPSSVPSFEI